MFSLHQVRGPSAAPRAHESIFKPREPHFMLEILGYAVTPEKHTESEAWAERLSAELEKAASSSGALLPTAFVSIYSSARSKSTDDWVKKVYGDSAGELRNLKASFDPENLFKLTVPSLQ
ncbi:hypothetical protein N7493_008702 [Penicillium malachiteum]|uniref:Berberine/berberine-like domain-containing protein n=1 Tax=Penicillium malachiteum TaxID=1324776 RepID=A0AAD6MSW0_9EURO|nr:hypothetical protein N7493_008702 [Penicillium malachiteum]